MVDVDDGVSLMDDKWWWRGLGEDLSEREEEGKYGKVQVGLV